MNSKKETRNTKIIFFEVNELPYRVLDDYCFRHPDSSFAKLLAFSHQYESFASASRPLEPCFNWPTIHRGILDQVHGIYDWNLSITEQDRRYPPVWKILASNGISVGVFGSLHSYASFPIQEELNEYAFYVPDIFSPEGRSYPNSVSSFQAFNLSLIRKSARNVDLGLEWKNAYRIAKSISRLGLMPNTIVALGKQIASEKITPWKKTRRRTHQAKLSFDVFFHLLGNTRPEFATCFVNHVAATMHRYWAAVYPEHYTAFNMTSEWCKRYQDEIDYAMNKTDQMLEKLLEFLKYDEKYTLILCSGMGQAATIAEHLYTELYIQELSVFMNAMGIEKWSWSPAMFPHFNIMVGIKDIARFKMALDNLFVEGVPMDYTAYPSGQFCLHLGQQDLLTDWVEFHGKKEPLSSFGLHRLINEDTAQRTGYHIPEGTLLVYNPRYTRPRDDMRSRVSTLAIAPSILESFGLSRPAYMTNETIWGIVDNG